MYYQETKTISDPIKTCYTFNNWTKSRNSTIQNRILTMGTEATTLEANWNIIQYTITFDPNGGTINNVNDATQVVNCGSAVTLLTSSQITRLGYTFAGWWTDATGGTEVVAGTIPNQSQTLYAHWTINNYTITYNLNSGTQEAGAKTSYTIEDQTFNLPNPTRTDYVFGGWYEISNFTGNPVTSIINGSTGNKVYYARWYDPPEISITSAQVVDNGVTAASNQKANITWNISGTSLDNESYTYKVIDYYNQTDKRTSSTAIANGANYTFTQSYDVGRHLIVVEATSTAGDKTYESYFFIVREYGNTSGGLSGIAMNTSQTLDVEDPGVYDSNGNPLSYTSGFEINVPSISGHSSGNSDTFYLYGWNGTQWVQLLFFYTNNGYCHVTLNNNATSGTWQSSDSSGTFNYPQQTYYKIKFVYWNAHAVCVANATNSASYSVSYDFISNSSSSSDPGNDSGNVDMSSLFNF